MSGIAPSSLIALVPVPTDAGLPLRSALAALPKAGELGLFARAPGTHFGRFVFVSGLAGADGRPLPSSGSFLFLAADFDPGLWEWTAGLCRRAGDALDSVMRHCPGWPGSDNPAAVLAYLENHRIPAGFTVAGHPPASVDEIRDALRLRGELRALAARSQGERLSPAELRRAWTEVTGG